MTTITASAPGKAVLLGEYAVLEGAPALVMAVERRARVRITPCSMEASQLEVPQLSPEPVPFGLDGDGGLVWKSAGAQNPAFQRARFLLEWLTGDGGACLPPSSGWRIRIDTAELYQHRDGSVTKLGLGSSAAMTVALAGALRSLAAPESAARIVQLLQDDLLAPYRAGQGGRGSGIDLAASLHGQIQRYQLSLSDASSERVALPRNLKLAFVWTGKAASTGHFLAGYERWRESSPTRAGQMQRSLEECCSAALDALRRDDAADLMTCINNYRRLMGKIGDLTGLPLLSASLSAIARTASAHGLACKPCGAGGGDLAVLAGLDAEALDQACRSLGASGWPRLAMMTVARSGLQVDISSD